jgi:hypothetical protein
MNTAGYWLVLALAILSLGACHKPGPDLARFPDCPTEDTEPLFPAFLPNGTPGPNYKCIQKRENNPPPPSHRKNEVVPELIADHLWYRQIITDLVAGDACPPQLGINPPHCRMDLTRYCSKQFRGNTSSPIGLHGVTMGKGGCGVDWTLSKIHQ